jgi:hypothetical protein
VFGDKPILVHEASLTSTKGFAYTVVAKTLNVTPMSGADGRTLTVNGAFTDLLGSVPPPPAKPLKFQKSQFAVVAPQMGPAGTTGDIDEAIALQATPRDGSAVPTPHAFVGASAELLNVTMPRGSTADIDVGSVVVTNPYPANWYTLMNTGGGALAPIGCGTGNTPLQVGVADFIIDDASSMLAKAANPGIAPVLPPVQLPGISASATGPFANAFLPQAGVTATPTLQWTVQSSLPLPNYMRIFVYSIGVDSVNKACIFLDANGNPFGQNQVLIAQLFEVAQSGVMTLTFPSGILTAGRTYIAVIRSTYEPGRDVVNRPLMRGSAEYVVEVVTNTFTP